MSSERDAGGGAGSSSDPASVDGDSPTGGLPAVDFSTFLLSLGHSALVNLGEAPGPGGQSQAPALALARQTIDLIALLGEKTKGNLSGEEERILEQLLYDLRVRFVEASKTT